MPKDSINKEVFPTSKYAQINLPTGELDGSTNPKDFESGSTRVAISAFDTNDKDIYSNLIKETLPISAIIIREEANSDVVIEETHSSVTVIEPAPTGDKAHSDKIKVFNDFDNMTFYMDHTPDNETIHMRHTSGTYWSMLSNGNFFRKVKQDEIAMVEGDQYTITGGTKGDLVKGEYTINAQDGYSITSESNFSLSVAGGYGQKVRGSAAYLFAKDRTTNVDGNDEEIVGQVKILQANDKIIIKAVTELNIEAKNVYYNVGEVNIEAKGGFTESVMGLKEISADSVMLNAGDNITLFSSGDMTLSCSGKLTENISGVSLLNPGTVARETSIALGNWECTTEIGNTTLQAGIGGLSGKMEVTLPGITTIDGLTQTVVSSTVQVSVEAKQIVLDGTLISIGGIGASEPAVLGTALLTWLNEHIHPTGVGPSSPALKPALPDILSTTVLLA